MTQSAVIFYRDRIRTLQKLVDRMRQDDEYGEEWGKKAQYLLSDIEDYLDQEEENDYA